MRWLSISVGFVFLCVISAGSLLTAAEPTRAVTFEMDVQPLLTRFGCNAGACHGKSRGQNGFALSLLGFDSDFDYESLVQQARGRRVIAAAPEMSLLLKKAVGEVPHGGGARFAVNSSHYQLLHEWIRTGAQRTPADAPKLVRVVVEPATQSLRPKEQFPLKVIAEYSDGARRDVTDGTAFQTNDKTVAAVNADGMVQAGPIAGEAAVMARYMNNIAVCAVTIPLPGNVPAEAYTALPRQNEIDDLVWKKLKLLGMLPSSPASDAAVHRRAYLRIIGRLPTPEETRAYLADTASDKRQQLVERLLERPEYGDFWANKWADLLRPNPFRVGMKAVWTLDAFLRDSFRQNKPYDQFVREIVTAQGSTWRNGATVVYRDRPETVEIASSMSQLFLGIRLECAKCHHHVFEVWSQDDFYGFAAFFSKVGRKGQGLSPPISGGEEMIFTNKGGGRKQLRHGRTGELVEPKMLVGPTPEIGDDDDPREVLANWMTAPDNPFFAKVMANRVWAEMMGVGLVDPVDDLRATNPASNEPLLDFLAQDFRASGYNIKHLIRQIATAHVFTLSTVPGERNLSDTKNFSRYYRQRLRAEVLLDAVNDVLGTEEDFAAMPASSRATQLWTHRSSSLFLDTFGRPDPNQDPPCERTSDFTTPQVLHLMNSPALNRKLIQDAARPAQLAASEMTSEQIVEDAFLRTYCRLPTEQELKTAAATLPARDQRRTAVEDLFWALLNTPEFYFID
ncbi:MAG TPA: DUF1549 and DUF1553 domain-containing protein [Planctomycetaceae bacterium]|nr:DUF1549 and DUF1553 domain-containing protein [Planctomycetaceae bacterium]